MSMRLHNSGGEGSTIHAFWVLRHYIMVTRARNFHIFKSHPDLLSEPSTSMMVLCEAQARSHHGTLSYCSGSSRRILG
ncbi:hypothetical protein HBI56_116050 [Parastagonospora nodorum]|uniref:Uncharacterized protein n=1 Tax=Phaeosphaeria nodorum (strain SN15 / ATCC MYA-4574 / FGSC 10173) TaxID=321614 RepID=A0A7U2F8D6_PHANO|nr:hypothetical protein HBH56_238540 [Parastagonospora nodorum]QRD00660.1 hypothetical protein JI435_092060 [Parastagonospora nodorum SN15]KAH3925943.1 hypothetical protein HBH54_177330 [Parastagonospora nodorum]KAH3953005.1 hypothetical protein HBH53_038710 [Parastagonospora nodorum]KAH3976359.1 hypothetical protein HBH52_119940 [Parastagonospora nodorum]